MSRNVSSLLLLAATACGNQPVTIEGQEALPALSSLADRVLGDPDLACKLDRRKLADGIASTRAVPPACCEASERW